MGQVVTVYGSGFGTSDPGLAISVGRTACGFSLWLSATSAKCILSPGIGTPKLSVQVVLA